MLLARAQFFAVGFSFRERSALGCPITTKDGDQTGAFDERHHIFRRRRAPEEGAPNAQQDCKGELDEVPAVHDTMGEGGGNVIRGLAVRVFGVEFDMPRITRAAPMRTRVHPHIQHWKQANFSLFQEERGQAKGLPLTNRQPLG